jgi:hypothetical protein
MRIWPAVDPQSVSTIYLHAFLKNLDTLSTKECERKGSHPSYCLGTKTPVGLTTRASSLAPTPGSIIFPSWQLNFGLILLDRRKQKIWRWLGRVYLPAFPATGDWLCWSKSTRPSAFPRENRQNFDFVQTRWLSLYCRPHLRSFGVHLRRQFGVYGH